MVIAITGGIACGKTTVLEYIKSKGYVVYNSDEISHKVLEEEKVKEEIKNKISKDVIENNKINRKKLGEIVFCDSKKLKILNDIVHPIIINKILEKISKISKNEIVFFEVPLLFELNLEKYFDKTIVIYSNKETQIKRIQTRDNLNKEAILKRLDKQIDIEEKKRKADIVIQNTRKIEELRKNVDIVVRQL